LQAVLALEVAVSRRFNCARKAAKESSNCSPSTPRVIHVRLTGNSAIAAASRRDPEVFPFSYKSPTPRLSISAIFITNNVVTLYHQLFIKSITNTQLFHQITLIQDDWT